MKNGVNTNPVHVIDISILLPLLLLTAILLLKNKELGYLLTPILLVFFIMMVLAILRMILVMSPKEISTEIGLAIIFIAVIVISTLITAIIFKKIK
ncbi:MAG: hypothetical protein ACTSXH_07145 [Promethearchaeota archaeon]